MSRIKERVKGGKTWREDKNELVCSYFPLLFFHCSLFLFRLVTSNNLYTSFHSLSFRLYYRRHFAFHWEFSSHSLKCSLNALVTFLLCSIPRHIALHGHLSVWKVLGSLAFIINTIHMSMTLTVMVFIIYIKSIAGLIYSLRLVSCVGWLGSLDSWNHWALFSHAWLLWQSEFPMALMETSQLIIYNCKSLQNGTLLTKSLKLPTYA